MENTATKEKFSTLLNGLESLKSEGYTLEFTVQDEKMINSENHTELSADDITVDQVYHFEGESSPNDRSALYAISSSKNDLKGTLVNGKGTAADEDVVVFLKKLDVHDAADEAKTDKTAIAKTDLSESDTTDKSEIAEMDLPKTPESDVPMPPKTVTTDSNDDTASITTYDPDESANNGKESAPPKDEEGETTSMTATNLRPEGERSIKSAFLEMDLNKFIQQIKDETTWADSQHNSITIFKADQMRMVLMGFHKDAELKPHSTKGMINVQVLHGAIKFTIDKEMVELKQGQMIAVHENITHSLKAIEESFVLLTVVITD